MKRKGFVIFIGIVLALVVCAAPFGGVTKAKEGYDDVVEATGEDEANCERLDLPGVFVTQDVCNVQAAVNANPGGKILLKGTFHFAEYGDDGYVVSGTDGTVFITNDIEIIGEKQGNEYLTKIMGGYNTFSIGYTPFEWAYDFSDEVFSSLENAVQVSATIEGIEFENTLYTPVRIWATTGSIINGNRIIDGRSLGIEEFFGPGSHASAFGILAGPPKVFLDLNPDLLIGDIKIKNNYIDGRYRRSSADDPWSVPSFGTPVRGLTQGGIALTQYVADTEIKNNKVYNVGMMGILAGSSSGIIEIKNNLIYMVSDDAEIHGDGMKGIPAWGCYVWYFSDASRYIIKDNDITVGGDFVGGEDELIIGIDVDCNFNKSVVKGNTIHMVAGGDIGISLWWASDANVTDNEIEGESKYGLVLGHIVYPSDEVNYNNTLKNNVLDSFTAEIADYFLGIDVTNNNLYVEEEDTVLDESGNDTNTIYR